MMLEKNISTIWLGLNRFFFYVLSNSIYIVCQSMRRVRSIVLHA